MLSNRDEAGEEMYKEYKYSSLIKLNEKKLKELTSQTLLVYEDAYFVLNEKYFSKYSDKLRSNIDDKYKKYFSKKIDRLESYVKNSVINTIRPAINTKAPKTI